VLGVTLWLVVAIGLFATVFLDAAATFGHAALRAAADHAIEAAMHDAVADYQNQLQAALSRDALAGTPAASRYDAAIASIPSPLERAYPAQSGGDASFTLAYDVAPTTISAPQCPPGASPPAPTEHGPDAVAWLQCNAFVAESRMSLRVIVRVLDASGNATLARREQFVTLRLFGEPPYSAVAGRKDASATDPASADALASPAHEGDVAGDTVSGTPPAPLASPWPAGGTLIHVRYECHDGAGSCANAAPPDPDESLRAGARWENGNRPPP
jgi:hypothetical protein